MLRCDIGLANRWTDFGHFAKIYPPGFRKDAAAGAPTPAQKSKSATQHDDRSMTILCHIDELAEGSAKGFTLDSDALSAASLFAIKRDGQIFVYRNSCPHLGVELNWQEDQFLDSDNALIQCATHGALFIIESGECIAGPCHGKRLTAIPFSIVDRHIKV